MTAFGVAVRVRVVRGNIQHEPARAQAELGQRHKSNKQHNQNDAGATHAGIIPPGVGATEEGSR